jgi:insulysin
LGTKKYPDEDEYESFLSKFGGFGNAYTDMEDTNYYFSISSQQNEGQDASEGLRGGLDRLAQFFISPTCDESMVERELRAIDSEYRNGKTNDAWRNYQFLKKISNQKHPFSKFGCGNYETLTSQGSPVSELKRFWKEYYTTSNMRLTVVGRSSLDALQRAVEESFGDLPYSNEPPRRIKENPKSSMFPRENAVYDPEEPAFGQQELGKIREVIPLLETRSVKVHFSTPPMDDPVLRKTKPHRVLSHLLGHESPGSLHSLLNELGLITGLSSGASIDTSDFSLFGLTLSLTPKGMEEKDLVLELIFQWIALIKKTAIEQPELLADYHNELRQISANNFKFRESGDPTDFCTSASELMFDDENPAKILASGSLVNDYDTLVAEAFLERLKPQNAMVTIVNSSVEKKVTDGWKVEPLYGATYRESDISDEKLTKWEDIDQPVHHKLHLPALNKYIPSDFLLRCDDDKELQKMTDSEREETRNEYPTLLKQGPNFRLWVSINTT